MLLEGSGYSDYKGYEDQVQALERISEETDSLTLGSPELLVKRSSRLLGRPDLGPPATSDTATA